MKKEIIKLTKDLIRFQSVSDNYSECVRIIDFVENYFLKSNVIIHRYEKNGVPSLVVSLQNTKKPKIFLSGHLDVAPAKQGQFKPYEKDKKLYGRGAGDMKAACAVMMYLIKELSLKKEKTNIALMLTTDEEVGGEYGAKFLIEDKGYRADVAIVPDGGKSLKTIVLNEKGVLHLKVKSNGKTAHGARPFLGINAIDDLINKYHKLREYLPVSKDKDWVNTMNLSKISGGVANNSVPDKAEMILDIRYLKVEDKDKILTKIKKIFGDYELLAFGYPNNQDKDNNFISKYIKICESVIKEKIILHKAEGSSDARFFAQYASVCIVTYLKHDNLHSEDEWVDIEEIYKFYEILSEYIEKV